MDLTELTDEQLEQLSQECESQFLKNFTSVLEEKYNNILDEEIKRLSKRLNENSIVEDIDEQYLEALKESNVLESKDREKIKKKKMMLISREFNKEASELMSVLTQMRED